ncbi:thrombomodulin [Eleginops maclovinus]|uniref:thrombomodulin n=1 Tax=Eleginops maclovinus TaxID=56733 RepID=UPI0030810AA9
MTAFVPVRVITMTFLISVIFLLSVETGFSTKQAGVCRPFCTGNDCITVKQDRVDFQTAEKACFDRNGSLMTFQSEADERTLDIFRDKLYGDFWIGMRLPASTCSNLSAPLRGYKWTSGSTQTTFLPSFISWKDRVEVCSPHCVSLSKDGKWTERLCSDKADGFLCRTKYKDACQAEELSDPNVILSSKGCSVGPCEHTCKDEKGGYVCFCFPGYIQDDKDPGRCKLHCGQQKCPAICDRGTDDGCLCPDGYVLSEKICEDIDECSNYGCDQHCKNTFGSFVCFCREGFTLKDHGKCVKAEGRESLVVTSPVVISVVKPAANNHTQQGAAAPAGGVVWIWITFIVAVAVIIIVIRFYVVERQKRRGKLHSAVSTFPVNNIESQIQDNS